MAKTFVRYSTGVERVDPDFGENLQVVLAYMKRRMAASVKAEGANRAIREAHATGYGLVRGEVEILKGLPTEYAQGIYRGPGRHEALVRFSNGIGHLGPDSVLGTVLGMGLKMFDIKGKTALEDEPDSCTFDYATVNHPVFFANTVEHYVFIQEIISQFGKAPLPNETAGQTKARIHRLFHDFLTGKGTLPPEEWAWEELGVFLQITQIPVANPLLSTYWTMGAVRHGDYIAKVRIAPVKEFADRVVQRNLDLNSAEHVFRPALIAELGERPYEFDIQVQLCTDLEQMPVEDVTVRWPENLSQFVTVAKLRLPKQNISGEDNLQKQDATSITPWRVTEEHHPLGNIMHVRKEVYRQSSLLRHQINNQSRKEPKNVAEVFDS
jgi:hypothetical protein